ncbi:glycosyltransferase family 2 protein [Soonwooa sp.]|uniref:glycosyltransferase family 2 protein n=1 Tax=Soonwooa sp. TaxID=1938592 RepID=UPI00262D9401|nr:glycosyltransferase family 2 protein [Soonwooa sp.]
MLNNENLVSIIIPNYNRASLIGETLESIISQTYHNWECIIVDDGSTDNSLEVIAQFAAKDSRIKLFQRPQNYPKGANACRNIGMSKSTGDYIIFFDSDDLMLQNHIEAKLKLIKSNNYDFAVTRSAYFNNPDNINPINYRDLGTKPITADNFITKQINWITFDIIVKADIAKSISFTEKNQSAEEYNYFVKLVLKTENAIDQDIVLTDRRYHEGSFQYGKGVSDKQRQINYFYYYWDTYQEIKSWSNLSDNARKFMLDQCYTILKNNNLKLDFNSFILEYFKFYKVSSLKKIFNLL